MKTPMFIICRIMTRIDIDMNNTTFCYEYDIAGSAHWGAPTLIYVALISFSDDEAIELPECLPFGGEWGENDSVVFMENALHPSASGVHIIYLSIIEKKFYIVNELLKPDTFSEMWEQTHPETGDLLFSKMIVGMAPYGGIAIWLSGLYKEVLISWIHGRERTVDIEQFLPDNPNGSISDVCKFYISADPRVRENLEKNGLPPRDLFDNYMKQFMYRYMFFFEHWNVDKEEWQKYGEEEIKPEFDYIEEALFDGTHDKLHDGGLMKYHQAGKPKKLAVKWHINKSEYTAYFWFEDEAIREVFDRFYGAHPDTKTDFMIRIDSEKNKYELALYRYGLKEPRVINESAYQLIVFKNKFEYYRSENYNQPKGAWIW